MKLPTTTLKLGLVIVVFIAISVALALIPASTIVKTVGSDNAYLLMFVLGGIGGLTTFSGIPYHVILMSFAAGGINPILLGGSTALGVMVGDSTTYLISKRVGDTVPLSLKHWLDRVARFLDQRPRLLTPLLILYGTVSPFSNDFIVASLTLTGHSYWRIILPLAIGNTIFNIGLAYLGLYAYDSIMAWW